MLILNFKINTINNIIAINSYIRHDLKQPNIYPKTKHVPFNSHSIKQNHLIIEHKIRILEIETQGFEITK